MRFGMVSAVEELRSPGGSGISADYLIGKEHVGFELEEWVCNRIMSPRVFPGEHIGDPFFLDMMLRPNILLCIRDCSGVVPW